jgi:hypothetical protein
VNPEQEGRTISLKWLPAAAASLMLSACAASTTPPSTELDTALRGITGQNGRACVRVSDISGYGAPDDSTVSVSSKFRKHYLMITRFRCPELATSLGAAFSGRFTEFCGGRDSILAGGRSCPIQSVFEFESRQAAFEALDAAEQETRAKREKTEQ